VCDAAIPSLLEAEKLERIVAAGRLAPSSGNRQGWKFVVVKDQALRTQLAVAAHVQKSLAEAPVVIVACAVEANHTMGCGQFSYPVDLAIAVDHMSLTAVEEGLGNCWIGSFDEQAVKEILGIPEPIRVAVLLSVGYPDVAPDASPRKRKEDIVVFDRWQ